jgi:hypothetical protein
VSGVGALYTNAIQNADTLEPLFQQRVFNYAKRNKDEPILIGLLGRRDLSPSIDAEIGAMSTAKVLSAWFARPGRTREEVLARLAKEKRVTVLESAARQPNMFDEVYLHCAQFAGSLRVAIALVENQSATLESRCIAARCIGQQVHELSYRNQHTLAQVVSSTPEVASAFALGIPLDARSDAQAPKLALDCDGLDPEAIAHLGLLAGRYIALATKLRTQLSDENQRNTYIHYISNPQHQLRQASEILRPLLIQGVDTATAESLLATLDGLRSALSTDSTLDLSMTTSADELTDAIKSRPRVRAAASVLARLQAASSPEQLLDALRSSANAAGGYSQSAAYATLVHTHVSAEAIELVSRHLGWGTVERALDARPPDTPVNIVVELLVRRRWVDDALLRRCGRFAPPRELWLALVRRWVAAGSPPPPELLGSTYASAEAVPELPVALFRSSTVPGWLSAEMARYLTDALDDTSFDAFEILAPKHNGTLASLVDACKRMSR